MDQSSRSLLATLGIAILMGRRFQDGDRMAAPRAVIVNQEFVRRHFNGQNPVGKWITLDDKPGTIVGVAGDAKFNDLREKPTPVAFLPIDQFPARFNVINVRTSGPATAAIPRPATGLSRATSCWPRLSGLFGALALLVACFGIYGMISYVVSSRTSEIGIRLALGAQPSAMWGSVIADALKTVVPGLVLGIGGALAMERYIEALLFNVTGRDPWTYSAVAASLILTSVLAAWLPAQRAPRIDPVVTLRGE